jgi:hypothetical protein
MMNRTRTGIALLMLSHGLFGCGDHGSPSAPSSPRPDPIQPTVAAVAPHEGSDARGFMGNHQRRWVPTRRDGKAR